MFYEHYGKQFTKVHYRHRDSKNNLSVNPTANIKKILDNSRKIKLD